MGMTAREELPAPLEELVGVGFDGAALLAAGSANLAGPRYTGRPAASNWRSGGQACYNEHHGMRRSPHPTVVAAAPFRGLRYDPAVVGDPGAVTAPPYDVISAEACDAFEARHPYNVVRLILARGGREDPGRYAGVADLIAAWRDHGVLVLDPEPALYLYEERYLLDGAERVQRGVLAGVRLDDTGSAILPHERTMLAPVADRLHLLEATHTNLSPVFGVYAGGGRAAAVLDDLTGTQALVDAVDETGVTHRLWRVTDPQRIAAWQHRLADQQVLIADGHHRYRTALAYRERMRAANPGDHTGPWDEVLMFLVDADLHGPSVRSFHRLLAAIGPQRVLTALGDAFEALPVAGHRQAMAQLARRPRETLAFGLYGAGSAWLLVARSSAVLAKETGLERPPLDVEVLHGPVLADRLGVTDFERQVAYEGDLAAAVRQVDDGAFASAILLRPVTFTEVVGIARGGETLPPKTTFFYPKPRDGLVLRPLEPDPCAVPAAT